MPEDDTYGLCAVGMWEPVKENLGWIRSVQGLAPAAEPVAPHPVQEEKGGAAAPAAAGEPT